MQNHHHSHRLSDLVLCSLTFLLVLTFAAPITASAGDACKDVKFKVKNSHKSGERILITKVKYYNRANGRWQTEVVNQNYEYKPYSASLTNPIPLQKGKGLLCKQGRTCTTRGDNLRDAEGEDITKVRFVYKYWAAGRWSGVVESASKSTQNPECVARRTYGGGSKAWTIFGA